jgi:hypothetical protein
MLRQTLQTLHVMTPGEGFTDLTGQLNAVVAASGLQLGLLNLVCLHTSCSLTINENADPRVLADLAAHLRALVPEEGIRPVSGRGELRSLPPASSASPFRTAACCWAPGRPSIYGSTADGAAAGSCRCICWAAELALCAMGYGFSGWRWCTRAYSFGAG